MASRERAATNAPNASSSDEEEQPSGSGRSSQSREFNSLVNDLVHFFIVSNIDGLPFTKQAIKKTVFQNSNTRLYKDVFQNARHTLRKVFGMEIVELENKKDSYILKNAVQVNEVPELIHRSPLEDSKNHLLLIILSLIFMNGNSMKEDDLWATLKCLGIDKDNVDHPVFGDIKKLVTREFKDKLYLVIEKPVGNAMYTTYSWGERAKVEVSKKKVLDFVCEVYGNTEPEQWLEQYKDIQSD